MMDGYIDSSFYFDKHVKLYISPERIQLPKIKLPKISPKKVPKKEAFKMGE